MEIFNWEFNKDTKGIWTGRWDMYGNKIYEGNYVETPHGSGQVRYNPKYWRFEVAEEGEPLENERIDAGKPEECWKVIS